VNFETEDGTEEGDRLAIAEAPQDRIARLEQQLERLAEARDRCRKIKLVAQIALAGGAVWIVAALIGLIGIDPVAMLAAIAGVIGGIVLYGSNATTAEQIAADMEEAEAERTDLIENLDLRVVPGPRRWRIGNGAW
jgi:Flp pilus assembly protein TadB